jgi:NADPH:quinone reductase-like Zn-dependent oxidoreductase
MKAVRISAFGDPLQVTELVDMPAPGEPSPNEVLLAMEYAPISFVTRVIILGLFGERPPLPAIAGYEGVAQVLSVGAAVRHVRLGDHVLVTFHGCWCERLIVPARELFALPNGVDLMQFSLVPINGPTARLMLSEFVPLQSGDWLIQNAANSGIGRAVMAIAQQRGLRTVNVVRRRELVDELKAAGGDVVLVDGPNLDHRVAEATSKGMIMLGIDGVGGDATLSLVSCLGEGATLVCYATAGGNPVVVPGLPLIFRDLRIRSFWARRWYKTVSADQFVDVQRELVPLVARGAMHVPIVATYPLLAYREALAHAAQAQGRVLLKCS